MAAIRLHHAPFALPEARTGFATTLRGTVDPLGRFAMVVFQQATESITAFDVASNKADFIAGVNDLVLESLVVSFLVVMREVFAHGVTQRTAHQKRSSSPDTRISESERNAPSTR